MTTSNAANSSRYSHRRLLAWLAACGIALLVAAACSLPASAQRGSSNGADSPTVTPNVDPMDMPPTYANSDPMHAKMEQKRLKALNTERQKAMVADTNKLLKLATDLNAQINSDQHSQLTPDQQRQLAEIEKLAHSVRDKMSAAVQIPQPIPMIVSPASMR